MSDALNSPPRVFLSYSWSSPDHQQWVLDLATELAHSGVHVILDKWDLREGHDAIPFMEGMVTDPSIKKVILVCDQLYAAKADGREGGVGTETQIISAEVYAKQVQDKFVAVIAERDNDGNPYLPTYYKTRIFIDLSEHRRYSEEFERLVRWIFDKPLYTRPEIGKRPAFIDEVDIPLLGTSVLARRACEGLRRGESYAGGALTEYFSTFAENLERFRITRAVDGEFDEQIVKSIEAFAATRNEFIDVASTLALYGEPSSQASRIHRFFESLLPYLLRPQQGIRIDPNGFDNFKFIIHELYLYTLVILLRSEHFEATAYLLSQPYYLPGSSEYGSNAAVSYTALRDHIESFEIRNNRLELNRTSLKTDLIKERSEASSVLFRHIMQADLVCFLKAHLSNTNHDHWFPDTLLYASRQNGPFEIFARSISRSYLARILPLLGMTDIDSVRARLRENENPYSLPRWGVAPLNLSNLLGLHQLGTRP